MLLIYLNIYFTLLFFIIYQGITFEHAKEVRKNNLNPALFSYYKNPLFICKVHAQTWQLYLLCLTINKKFFKSFHFFSFLFLSFLFFSFPLFSFFLSFPFLSFLFFSLPFNSFLCFAFLFAFFSFFLFFLNFLFFSFLIFFSFLFFSSLSFSFLCFSFFHFSFLYSIKWDMALVQSNLHWQINILEVSGTFH